MTSFDKPAMSRQVIKNGRYQAPDPATGQMKEWTRATNLAATLADKFGLTLWGKAMVVLGLGARHDLFTQAASCRSYEADKHTLYSLVKQAEDAAESKAGANLGSALHRFIERLSAGEDVTAPAPYDKDLAAYEQAMDAHGIAVLDGWSERILLVPELEVAGTCDMLTNGPDWAEPCIADVKTGKDVLEYGMVEIPQQLAIYSRATHWYDPVANQTHPIDVAVDQQRAVVIHLPAGRASCTLYEVDIAAGWEAVQLAVQVRNWRNRKGLAQQMISAATWAPTPRLVAGDGTVEPSPQPSKAPVPSTISTARLHWVQERCRKLVDDGYGPTLMEHWPVGVPIFRDGGPRTNTELMQIAEACNRAEAIHGRPFGQPDPDLPPSTKASIKQQKEKAHEPV